MTVSSEPLALLGRAAELRAAGTPWADAAAQLTVGTEELRKLASEHARDYDRLMRRARTEVLRETLDAALTALRGHVKSAEPGVSMRAATTIVRYELARIRNGPKKAAARLERDIQRRRTVSVEAENVRAENASESPKVPNQQEVNAAKKVTQSCAPSAAPSPPPAPPRPAPATPPAAPATPPATARAAAPVAGKGQVPLDDAARRKQRLVDDFALGSVTPAPLTQDKRQTLEVDRLMRGWLAEQ